MFQKLFLFLCITFLLTGCGTQKRVTSNTHITIKDLQTIPQDPNLVDEFKLQNTERPSNIKRKYFEQYFKPWSSKAGHKVPFFDKEKILNDECYYETLSPCSTKWRVEALNNTNIPDYGKIGKYGIITRNTVSRILPTLIPWFKNPDRAGEGYPFDYMQSDLLYIGRPVFVSHLSLDKKFAYIEIPDYILIPGYVDGWVKTQDIAFLSQQQAKEWQNHEIAIIKTDNTPLFTDRGYLIESARLGTHLPILSQDKKHVTVAVPYPGLDNSFSFVPVKLPIDCCVIGVEKFTTKNIKHLVKELLFTHYGWGVYLGNRDCSAMIKDFYSIFHIWMPRNASSQNSWFNKNLVDLTHKTPQEKLEIITKRGIPFKTLLYMKGHIAIYSGIYNNQPVIFHTVWGNKTLHNGIEGRNIIGKTIFSTTTFGKELKFIDKSRGTFLQNLQSMLILEE